MTATPAVMDFTDASVLIGVCVLQKFACNGTVIEHPEYGEVIQLQGDQRKNICQFLTEVHVVHYSDKLCVFDVVVK